MKYNEEYTTTKKEIKNKQIRFNQLTHCVMHINVNNSGRCVSASIEKLLFKAPGCRQVGDTCYLFQAQ